MKPFVLCFFLVLLTGPVAGQPAVATADQAQAMAQDDTQADLRQDESWTWFGMGFEKRRHGRDAGDDSFGPDGRPYGGFGSMERRRREGQGNGKNLGGRR